MFSLCRSHIKLVVPFEFQFIRVSFEKSVVTYSISNQTLGHTYALLEEERIAHRNFEDALNKEEIFWQKQD